MKILHTADWHLDAPNQPAVYRELSLPKLLQETRSRYIKYVLISGDVFDRPNPDPRIKDYLISTLLAYPDITFILTVGNHDYTDKSKSYHSLNTFSILSSYSSNIKFGYEGYNVFDGFNLVVLPDDLSRSKRIVRVSNTNPTILSWHGVFPGLDVRSMDVSKCGKHVKKIMAHFGASYFALGDIHRPLEVADTCWYCGSLFQKTYSCVRGAREVDVLTGESSDVWIDVPDRVSMSVDYDVSTDTEETLSDLILKSVEHGSLLKLKFRMPLSAWVTIGKRRISDRLSTSFLEVKFQNDQTPDRTSKRASMKKFTDAKTLDEEVDCILETDKYENRGIILSRCVKYLSLERRM